MEMVTAKMLRYFSCDECDGTIAVFVEQERCRCDEDEVVVMLLVKVEDMSCCNCCGMRFRWCEFIEYIEWLYC